MADEEKSTVQVWDSATRLFHWAIVCLVAVSWISAEKNYMTLHRWSGSAVLALLIFRVAWGMVGSTTARFENFITGPRAVRRYLNTLVKSKDSLHAGHNPGGGWMVILMMIVLGVQAFTGLFANDGVRFNGPLALRVSQDASDALTALHGTNFNFLLLLAWVHLVAVFFYRFVKGEDLIGPMITGRKRSNRIPSGSELRFTRASVAWVLLALSSGIVWWGTRS